MLGLCRIPSVMLIFCQIWMYFISFSCVLSSQSNIRDVCIGETFDGSCREGSVVMITQALYGSFASGKCSQTTQHCEEDITMYADSECSGRKTCQFPVTNIIHAGFKPCANVLPSMRIGFECIQVTHSQTSDCYTNQAMIVTDSIGYISSMIAQNANAGTSECPWRLQAPEGKKIIVTLLDFGTWARQSNRRTACDLYGTLTETETGQQTEICGSNQRKTVIYKSKTSTLDVSIAVQSEKHFLIKYEILGCTEYTLPGTDVVTTDNTATVTCLTTGATWIMTCADSEWTGQEQQCHTEFDTDFIFGDDWKTIHVVLLVLCVGAVIGFLLGVCCIYIVVSCLRRHKHSQHGKTSTQLCKQDRPAPLEPDYHYKYVPGMNSQNNPLLQNNHTFIDPHTGMVYGKYNSRKDDMYGGGDAGNGTIRMNAFKDNHIYNTLEPRPDVLGSDTNHQPHDEGPSGV